MADPLDGALHGRSAVVTGASRGIGRAIATQLAAAGVRVVMTARSAAELARAAEEVRGHAIAADVSSPTAVGRLVEEAGTVLGGAPDFVVNSAGSFLLRPIVATEPAELEAQVAVNLVAPFLVARAFLPRMLERGSGHVLSVGSVAGRVAMAGNGAYSAAKYGLRGFHEVLAEELRGTGVRATLVEPAATDTPLWDALDPDSRNDLPSRGAMLRPDDVARAAVFALAQPDGVELSLVTLRSTR